MSLFDLLNIGTRGLAASQIELDVVGQNVTNADTEGYSRKTVNLKAGAKPDSSYGQLGYGVDVVNVQRIRDQLLDRQLQTVSTQQGGAQQSDDSLQSIQNIFTEPSDSGINTFLDKFWSSWQDLSNNPSDPTARQAVLDSGTALVGRFKDSGTQLDSLVGQTNDLIATTAGEVNQLLTGIDQDNQTISTAEVGGAGGAGGSTQANDTRDARELKLQQLSKLIGVAYTEDPQGRYTITASGNLLISPAGTFPLKVETSSFTLPDGTQTNKASLILSSSKQELVPQSGKLAALYRIRDTTIPKYQAQLDQLARTVVTAVNAQHEQGYDTTGTTGTDFFDPKTGGATTIALSSTVSAGVNYIAAASGGASKGLGAPLLQTIPALGTPLDLPNSVNANYRNLSKGTVIVSTVGPPPTTLQEGAGKDYVVDYQAGRVYFNNPAVFPTGTAITLDFRYTQGGYNGQGDGGNALKIAQIAQAKLSEPDVTGNPTATIGDSYATMVGAMGAEKNRSGAALTTANNLQTFYKKQAAQISGVSLDEELGNMVKFQNSYQASAKYISTVSKMLDSLINLG